jgi:hypothetical protein
MVAWYRGVRENRVKHKDQMVRSRGALSTESYALASLALLSESGEHPPVRNWHKPSSSVIALPSTLNLRSSKTS